LIPRPTVLILGAGASHPYGYPLGEGLVQQIIRLTGPRGDLHSHLSSNPLLEEFHSRLAGSDVTSIDDFLESNRDLAELGKLGIAAALTVWGPAHDYPPTTGQNWYRYLWGRLHEGAATTGQFRSNRVRFVTYNYDRSLERYLAQVLENTFPDLFNRGSGAAADFLTEVLPI
jgi:hypothetical protein